MNKIVSTILISSLLCLPALASQWKTFIEGENEFGRAKVEIDIQSIKTKMERGEKFVSFKIKGEWGNNKKLVKSYNHYYSSCETYQTTRIEGDFAVFRGNTQESKVAVKETQISRKEQIDLEPVINKLCKEY